MNILEVLADDTTILPYRKELREIAGSVAATIFLGQLLYWAKRKGNGFYKFKTPSENNPYYKKGDSWCEELGFSVDELDGAIKKLKAANLLDKKTLPDRRTIWTLNLELLSDKLSKLKATTEFTQTGKSELRNRENPSYVNGNFPVTKTGKEQLPYNTETTSEITTETTSESSSLSLANAREAKKQEAFKIPEFINPEIWKDFEAMRKQVKRPMSERAKKLIVARLQKFGEDKANEILEQSIVNCWQDVYPLKADKNNNKEDEYADVPMFASDNPILKNNFLSRDMSVIYDKATQIAIEDERLRSSPAQIEMKDHK